MLQRKGDHDCSHMSTKVRLTPPSKPGNRPGGRGGGIQGSIRQDNMWGEGDLWDTIGSSWRIQRFEKIDLCQGWCRCATATADGMHMGRQIWRQRRCTQSANNRTQGNGRHGQIWRSVCGQKFRISPSPSPPTSMGSMGAGATNGTPPPSTTDLHRPWPSLTTLHNVIICHSPPLSVLLSTLAPLPTQTLPITLRPNTSRLYNTPQSAAAMQPRQLPPSMCLPGSLTFMPARSVFGGWSHCCLICDC